MVLQAEPDGSILEKALVAASDPDRAGSLARRVRDLGMVPVLARSPDDLASSLAGEEFEIVLVDLGAGARPVGRSIRAAQARTCASLMELAQAGAGTDGAAPGDTLSWGPLMLEPAKRKATWRSRPLHLTSVQFKILVRLVRAGGSVLSVEQLASAVWGSSTPGDGERLFAHVRRIRKRIEDKPSLPRFLLTVRGEGFRLADQ